MMKYFLIPLIAVFYALLPFAGGVSEAQSPTWVRGYPSEGNPEFGMTAGCVYYVAQWSDGSYTSVPWDCRPGVVARDGSRFSSRGYPQRAANGCVEYVTQWNDQTYSWVPFECPPGVVYYKPSSTPPASGNATTPSLPTLPAVPAGGPSDTTAGWRTFTNAAIGISISLPPGWSERGYDQGFSAVSTSPPGLVLISRETLPRPMSLDLAAAIFEEGMKQTGSVSGTIQRQTVSLPAGQAVLLSYNLRLNNGDLVPSRTYIFIVGTNLYWLTFGAPAGTTYTQDNTFTQIAQTFRITSGG